MIALRTCLAGLQAVLFLLALPASVSAAQCTNPSIRKEWRALSTSERTDWIRAVNCLATLPHSDALNPSVNPGGIAPINTSSSYYDDLVYMHMDMDTLIRHNGYSLPWHRWFVYSFENALKTKCGFQGTSPYWDWRKDASDVFGSPFFNDSDPESGLGGWGDPKDDFEVQKGGFSVHSSFRLSYPSPHPLRRNFTLQPYINVGPPNAQFYQDPAVYANSSLTYSAIDSIINGFVGDFKGFQSAMEAFEGSVFLGHAILGGDLGGHCPASAPPGCVNNPGPTANEPLFWLHHGMIDKVWADWQSQDNQNANAFYGGIVQALDNVTYFNEWPTGAPPLLQVNDTIPNEGMFPANTIADMLSTTGGVLCYQYE